MQLVLTCHIVGDAVVKHYSQIPYVKGVTQFDIDNYSDMLSIRTCSNAIERASRLMVVFRIEVPDPPGSVYKALNAIRQYNGPICMVQIGEHAAIERLASNLRGYSGRCQGEEEVRKKILEFFEL